jgi:hypothetical protein
MSAAVHAWVRTQRVLTHACLDSERDGEISYSENNDAAR